MEEKKVRTSKRDFQLFKKEFEKWADILDLKSYQLYFYHDPLDGSYARISVDESGKVADIIYSSKLSKTAAEMSSGPASHALHEVLHLLLNRLESLGKERFTGSSEIDDEGERLVRLLRKVLQMRR